MTCAFIGAGYNRKAIVSNIRGDYAWTLWAGGLLHREAEHVVTSIAVKWDKSYTETYAYVREHESYLPWFEHQAGG